MSKELKEHVHTTIAGTLTGMLDKLYRDGMVVQVDFRHQPNGTVRAVLNIIPSFTSPSITPIITAESVTAANDAGYST